MKRLAVSVLITCFYLNAYSQDGSKNFTLSAGVSLSVPTYNFEPVKIGTGFDLRAYQYLQSKLALTADAGLNVFFADGGIAPTFLVPTRLGVKYHIVKEFFVFAQGGLGLYILTNLDQAATRKFAAISGGVGYQFSPRFDLQISYDGFSNKNGSFAYGQLRAGYYFVR